MGTKARKWGFIEPASFFLRTIQSVLKNFYH
jgi:hypothetical protein